MATLANGRIKNWSMEIHRIFFLDDGKWQNTFLEVKKCFPLNLNVWHKYFCLLQALPHHILQCILSLITVLLKWCFFLIWITSFIFNCSGYWKLFFKLCSDEWVLSCVRPIISVWVFARILPHVRKVFPCFECNTKLLDVTLEDSYSRQPNAMDIFDKFITKTSPGKIEDSSSRKGNLGVHDSIEWLISSMSLQFHIKLPRVPLKLYFGESILAMTHIGENLFYCCTSSPYNVLVRAPRLCFKKNI